MNVEALGQAAYQIAEGAGFTYLQSKGLCADPKAFDSCVKSWVKIKLPEALKDAKDAHDAHMFEIMAQTFKASMVLAGIEAAKEAAFPRKTL